MHMRLLLATIVVSLFLAGTSMAQQGPSRYQPSRRTISPYLNLGGAQFGAVPNYFSLVRPTVQFDTALRTAARELEVGQQRMTLMESRSGAPSVVGRRSTTTTAPRSAYLQYSHYYPVHRTYGQSRRPRGRR